MGGRACVHRKPLVVWPLLCAAWIILSDGAPLLDLLPVACISISGFKYGLPKAVEYEVEYEELSGKTEQSKGTGTPLPSTQISSGLSRFAKGACPAR